MRNIVITGGTDGMGKATAQYFLKQGDHVMVIGSTAAKGEKFLAEAQKMGAADRAIFLRADLSLMRENQRVIEAIKAHFDSLDTLIFCASKFQNEYKETEDGMDSGFASYYVSRYVLSYGLRDILEKARKPIIFNVSAPGYKGEIQWDDLQFKAHYSGLKVGFHGSRLNDLSGVAFAERHSNIRYILYNPGFVRTAGVTEAFDNAFLRGITKIAARLLAISPEQSAVYMTKLLENPPNPGLSAYHREKAVDLTLKTFDKANAKRLFEVTQAILEKLENQNVSGFM